MIKKQFIAGAVCPQCKALDRLQQCRDENREWMACVSCGYESERPTGEDIPADTATDAQTEHIVQLRVPTK